MGEYADDYFRYEIRSKFGFDPGEPEPVKRRQKPPKVTCKTCGKRVKEVGLKDHMRDAHGVT